MWQWHRSKGKQDARLTFSQVRYASLGHDGDPGGNISCFISHSGVIQSLRWIREMWGKHLLDTSAAQWRSSTSGCSNNIAAWFHFTDWKWGTYPGIFINLFIVYNSGGFRPLGLHGRRDSDQFRLWETWIINTGTNTSSYLHQSQEELSKVSRGVTSHVFMKILLEHCERWYFQFRQFNHAAFDERTLT